MRIFIVTVGITQFDIYRGNIQTTFGKAFLFREEAESYMLELKQRRIVTHMVVNLREQELGTRPADIAPAECLTYVNVIEHGE